MAGVPVGIYQQLTDVCFTEKAGYTYEVKLIGRKTLIEVNI